MKYSILVGYISTVFVANWLLETFGFIDIGFGLIAPAGVLAAGVAFTMRDFVHELLGRKWVIVGIVAGALASAFVSPQFAIASGLAFFASEIADMLVYSPLRQRNWIAAVAASNTIGLVADSILFLWLAFGSLDFLTGQVVGKTYMTIIAVGLLWAVRAYYMFEHCSWGVRHDWVKQGHWSMLECSRCGETRTPGINC